MKNSQQGFTFRELICVLAVIAALASMLIPCFFSITDDGFAASVLPPGTQLEQAPIPTTTERHFGEDWVIAIGQTNFMTVVYYALSETKILSVRPVTTSDIPGMYRYEVVVESSRSFSTLHHAFWTDTPRSDPNPLFIGVKRRVLEELKAKIPPKK